VEAFKAIAIHDFTSEVFTAQTEEILFFKAGQVVIVCDMDDAGHWWFGNVEGQKKQGWFPTEYVRKVDK
jgi:hypothetical protein